MVKKMALGLMLASSTLFTGQVLMRRPWWVWTYGPFVLRFSLPVYAVARYRRKKRFVRCRRQAIYRRWYFQEQYGPQLDKSTITDVTPAAEACADEIEKALYQPHVGRGGQEGGLAFEADKNDYRGVLAGLEGITEESRQFGRDDRQVLTFGE
ncbi:MAG TPA: hypothetical protein VH351_08080 [Bryobacteraceae bacterium]|jgi:hypothetical protein|nr:hypothetical protein [Bryobacteraceae bacterium]